MIFAIGADTTVVERGKGQVGVTVAHLQNGSKDISSAGNAHGRRAPVVLSHLRRIAHKLMMYSPSRQMAIVRGVIDMASGLRR